MGLVLARDIVPLGQGTTPKENMHPPPRLFSTFLVISGVHAGKTPYNTEHLKGFYTERICGTVFTDRCSQISTRIVCGQVHSILHSYSLFLFSPVFQFLFALFIVFVFLIVFYSFLSYFLSSSFVSCLSSFLSSL